MRIRPLLLAVPVMFAGSLLLATPTPALAAGGLTETGITTYVVNPAKATIDVTITLTEHNTKPSVVTAGGITYYYYTTTEIAVEAEASAVSATSNGGAVKQSAIASSNDYYRLIKLTYPRILYGEKRVLTVKYSIPAAPHAPGNFRAGAAYASLCAIGNGYDTGTVSITLPSAFDLFVDAGDDVTKAATAPAGQQTWTSGPLTAPYKFWTCVDAENADKLTHTSVVAGGQEFDIQSWPEDPTWSATISGYITADVQRLEDLTGLSMPGGTIQVREAGDFQLGNYGGTYNSATAVAEIPETIRKDTVAHELSHIWFNRQLLKDKWMSEGLAGFSEQAAGTGNYIACKEPGKYPDAKRSPNLMQWQSLSNTSTDTDEEVSDYQYGASCYIFTKLADDMGAANMKSVLKAVNGHEMAYVGATAGEKLDSVTTPITSRQMLDLIDEVGMVPGGVTDLDATGNLLSDYGIFSKTDLAERSTARTTYHALVDTAKTWKLPLAIRGPMNSWEFSKAEMAMDTATEILEVRDSIQKQLSDFSLDKSPIQTQFESARTQAALDSLLVLIKKEAAAAAKVDEATKLKNGNHSLLETIGLIGTDVETPLTQARTDLTNVKTDDATANAQTVIDRISKASDQGMFRVGGLVGGLALLLLLLGLAIFMRRRPKPALAMTAPMSAWSQQPPTAWDQPAPPWSQQPTVPGYVAPIADAPLAPWLQPQTQAEPPAPVSALPDSPVAPWVSAAPETPKPDDNSGDTRLDS